MNEHVKDEMLSHFTDLTKEFRALKFKCLQAQEQAIQREHLDLEKRIDRKIYDLRGFVWFLSLFVVAHRIQKILRWKSDGLFLNLW